MTHQKSNNDSTGSALSSQLMVFFVWLPMLLVGLLCISDVIRPVTASAVIKTGAVLQQHEDHCILVMENSKVQKRVGSVWISTTNPCAIHACELDDNTGRAYETITVEDCGQFYCDVDSEIRPKEGSCCGACVRIKCRFNDTVYDIGQTWHNNEDCTLLECTQLASGEPMINAYTKTCPPLPPDCEPTNIYTQNCCQYCRNSALPRTSVNDDKETEEIWTTEYYRHHPCVRDCLVNQAPKTCHYTFVVEWYETLSKACYNCPQNLTDCERPHCVVGDGIPRTVTVVNRMMPGPAIEVCENDLIVVDVKNDLLGESTTIHWHGLHQKDTPYMDGVPHISQCPISPHSTFRYSFKADNPGTHFWHSHTGMQRGDGVFGALIIRRPRTADPHAHLYDFDLPEHKMLVQDWVHVPGISMFASHHHSRGSNKPLNLLMNGRGRYYKTIWENIKSKEKAAEAQKNPTMRSLGGPTKNPPGVTTQMPFESQPTEAVQEGVDNTQDVLRDIDVIHSLESIGRVQLQKQNDNEISRLARLARSDKNTSKVHAKEQETTGPTYEITTEQQTEDTTIPNPDIADEEAEQIVPVNYHNRTIRSANNYEIPLDVIPHEVFEVRRGFRYRFRIINAEFLNCPIQISIDNHTLTAINSDGYDFESVEVGSIVTYAGERFDFIVHANQSVGNYWVRLKGLMDCSEAFTSAFQVAILRYENAPTVEPTAELGYHHKAEGIELNVMNRGPGYTDSLTIAELNGLHNYDSVPGVDRDALKPVADYKFFVYYDFYVKDNPVFHPAEYYGVNANLSQDNRLFTPQLNHISLQFPSMALLPARSEMDDSMFCNETSLEAQGIDCREEFCKCHHVLQVPLNSIVELIIVDEGFTFNANHPFHLHGNAFRVVGLERLGTNVTIEMVKQLDRYNLLKRNLIRPPVKDTVTVPDGGYTIIRFEAYNPGFWLFHCHIEFHAEIGMALILKVGDNDEMLPVPKHFPTCHDYMPNPASNDDNDSEEYHMTTTPETGRNGANCERTRNNLLLMLLLLLLPFIKSTYKAGALRLV